MFSFIEFLCFLDLEANPNGRNPFETTARKVANGDGLSLPRSNWSMTCKARRKNALNSQKVHTDLHAIGGMSEAKDLA